VGMAMMGRGEFAYLVAQTALITPFRAFSGAGEVAGEATMLSPDAYTSVVWALLTATVLTPFLFKFLLGRMARLEQGAPGEPGGDEALVKKWKIRIAHDLSPLPAESPAGGGEPAGGGASRSPRGSLAGPPAPPPPQNLMQALAAQGFDITAFEIISGGLLRSYNEVYTVEVTDDRVDKALRADVEAIEEKMHRIVNNAMQADQRYNLLIKPIRPGQLSRDCSLAIRPAVLPNPESLQPLAAFAGGAPKAPGGGQPRAGASGQMSPAALAAALEAAAAAGHGTGAGGEPGASSASLLPRGGSLMQSSSMEQGGQAPPPRGATPPQNLKLSMHFSEDPEYYGQLVSHLVETSMSRSASQFGALDQGAGGGEEATGPTPQEAEAGARRTLFGGLRRGRKEGEEAREEEEPKKKKKKKSKKKKK